MRVLLIGSGGREHALAWKLAQSPRCEALWIAPGNPGTAGLGTNVALSADDTAGIVGLATRERIDLVVVGPEAPLVAGLAEVCDAVDLPVFGPSSEAARIEGSKAFAKQIMAEAGVATADAHVFASADEARAFVSGDGRPWVVKADGLAAGKGVIVPANAEETLAAIDELRRSPAASRLVLEELLSGPEVSLLALCDGERALPLLPAQDHKRVGDGDTGPNTGGMGAFAPSSLLSAGEIDQMVETVFTPTLRALAARGAPYRGVLYAGLMLTPDGPRVLEFNARFGDPETQVLLPLLESDLLDLAWRCATGDLSGATLSWRQARALCVVLAAQGYPASPRAGDVIEGLDALPEGVLAFHAGTARDGQGRLVTAGGRVLGLTAVAPSFAEARERAYAAVDAVRFAGKHARRDIAAREVAL